MSRLMSFKTSMIWNTNLVSHNVSRPSKTANGMRLPKVTTTSNQRIFAWSIGTETRSTRWTHGRIYGDAVVSRRVRAVGGSA